MSPLKYILSLRKVLGAQRYSKYILSKISNVSRLVVGWAETIEAKALPIGLWRKFLLSPDSTIEISVTLGGRAISAPENEIGKALASIV